MIHRILRASTVPAILIATLLTAVAEVAAQAPGQDEAVNGRALYVRHCASCHGNVGEGDGPLASVMPVPNLRSLSARSGGEFPRETVLRYIDGRDLPDAHGDRLMPVWGDTFASEEAEGAEETAAERIAAITDFIEQLQN